MIVPPQFHTFEHFQIISPDILRDHDQTFCSTKGSYKAFKELLLGVYELEVKMIYLAKYSPFSMISSRIITKN